ncbi:MAG: hypothetical protein GY765_18285 [bacterium]|nr:hypothetical protein [bacterium]
MNKPTFSIPIVVVLISLLMPSYILYGQESEPVIATLLGHDLTLKSIGSYPEASLTNKAFDLKWHAWRLIAEDFVKKNNLSASEAEIKKAVDSRTLSINEQLRAEKKKLKEIEGKLTGKQLSKKQREQLEAEKRGLLWGLDWFKKSKKTEAEIRRKIKLQLAYPALCREIHKQYGGRVAMTKRGPDPVGAIQKLFEEHLQKGTLVIYNPKLKKAFRRQFNRKYRYIIPPDKVNFNRR